MFPSHRLNILLRVSHDQHVTTVQLKTLTMIRFLLTMSLQQAGNNLSQFWHRSRITLRMLIQDELTANRPQSKHSSREATLTYIEKLLPLKRKSRAIAQLLSWARLHTGYKPCKRLSQSRRRGCPDSQICHSTL